VSCSRKVKVKDINPSYDNETIDTEDKDLLATPKESEENSKIPPEKNSLKSDNPSLNLYPLEKEIKKETTATIFISYSHKDVKIASYLTNDLKQNSFKVWADISEIKGGDEWTKTIQSALNSSHYCLVILSPDGVNSQWVRREYLYAQKLGIKVIPLLYQDCEIPITLYDIQYIDFRNDNYNQALQRLLAALEVNTPFSSTPLALENKRFKLVRHPIVLVTGFLIIISILGFSIYLAFFNNENNSTLIASIPTATPTIISATETNTPIPTSTPISNPLPLPIVKKFSVNPTTIIAGESITIEWEVEGVDTVSIENLGDKLPPKQTLIQSPSETIFYVLNAANESGQIKPILKEVAVTSISNTPTPSPIIATATPSSTPTPTETPSPTNTSTPPPPTVTPTGTSTPTPEGTFTSLKILQADDLTFGLTDFEWKWSGSLPLELGFEVRVWRKGEPPAGVHNAVQDNKDGKIQFVGENKYRLSVDITNAAGVNKKGGDYLWTVLLVQIDPEYAELEQQAEPIQLHFEPPGGSDKGNGGSSGTNPGVGFGE